MASLAARECPVWQAHGPSASKEWRTMHAHVVSVSALSGWLRRSGAHTRQRRGANAFWPSRSECHRRQICMGACTWMMAHRQGAEDVLTQLRMGTQALRWELARGSSTTPVPWWSLPVCLPVTQPAASVDNRMRLHHQLMCQQGSTPAQCGECCWRAACTSTCITSKFIGNI